MAETLLERTSKEDQWLKRSLEDTSCSYKNAHVNYFTIWSGTDILKQRKTNIKKIILKKVRGSRNRKRELSRAYRHIVIVGIECDIFNLEYRKGGWTNVGR